MALPPSLVRPTDGLDRLPRTLLTVRARGAGIALAATLVHGCIFDWNSLRDGGPEDTGSLDVRALDAGFDAADVLPDRGVDNSAAD